MNFLKKTVRTILITCLVLTVGLCASAHASGVAVAKIGSTTYPSLGAAVEAANAMDLGTDEMIEIVLLQNLDLEEKLTISRNMTISGSYTINRTNNYSGQLFSVSSGVKLVLKDMTFEGNNNWTSDMDKLLSDTKNTRPVRNGYTTYVTREEGAPVGNKSCIIGVSGQVLLDNVTFQNFVESPIYAVYSTGNLELKDTTITHNTRASGGVLGNVDAGGCLTISDGTVISDNFGGSGNGMLGNIYGKAYINGGDFHGNAALDCNGYIFMLYAGNSYCEMNGGTIRDNICTYGSANGWNSAFYVYGNGATFVMNGGSIVSNYSSTYPGIANNGDDGTIILNGGTLKDNYSQPKTTGKDLVAYCPVAINKTVNSSSNRFYGDLTNNGTLNGNVWFYRYTKECNGSGTINGNVTVTYNAKPAFTDGVWNGVVTVNAYNYSSVLTVEEGATIVGGPVRILCKTASADSENAEEAAAIQAASYIEKDGANVSVPVLYYHRLSSDQRKDIVVTYDYNGGLDAENWSGIQRTSSEASYILEPLPEPVREGYVLDGWVLASNPDPESLDYSGSEVYVPGTPATESCRYIARWKPVSGDQQPPETGDSANLVLWMAMCLAGGAACLTLLRKKCKA